MQIHQDVPRSGCPAAPCNCSVVYRTSDHGRSWRQTSWGGVGPHGTRPNQTEAPLVAPLLRKDGRLVSLWQEGNRLLLDPSDPTNRTLQSPNGVWHDTGEELVLESEATVHVTGTPIAPGPGGESSMDTPMVMYQATEISSQNGGGHLLSAYGFAANMTLNGGCKGEAQDEKPGTHWWCYSSFVMHSSDEGASWQYRGRIDWTGASAPIEGPCESETVELKDGRLCEFDNTSPVASFQLLIGSVAI